MASPSELQAQLNEAQRALADSRKVLSATKKALADAEKSLRDQAEAYGCLRRCFDGANAPVVAVDRYGLITRWNRKAEEVFGCPCESALRRPFSEFLETGDQPGLADLQAAITSKAMLSPSGVAHLQRRFCVHSRAAGQPWHEVLFLASSCPSASSKDAAGVLYIGQEVTGLLKSSHSSEVTLQDRLIREVNAPLIAVDRSGCVEEWNRGAELLTGFTKEEAVGKRLVQNYIADEFSDSVQTMLSQGMNGQEITNYEFSLWTKSGQRKDILWSATARRDRHGNIVGVIGIGHDITELRSESKMLANYVRICGAAVWSLKGNAKTGVITDSKTREIEHLISQQAQMDICDPRMVLWRASFVSILKTMCQNFWMRRKGVQEGVHVPPEKLGERNEIVTTDFGYEFCFEAPNGSVKWYKVQGHLIQECTLGSQFEVTGSMQEVTSMLIDKVMGDRWQKWWSRMCHMVFDATLLVDTQEYRVLNAWGEEKVFGCKLQSHHPLLQLIKPEDTVSLKEAFNEVTFKGFERGRTLHLLRPGNQRDTPAQCFLLSADQENPNECMMGIRMQVTASDENVSVLWDVAKPNPVLTLEDLARLKSGLKRSHRRPSRNLRNVHQRSLHPRSRTSDPIASSHSLSSIPEDLHGEFEDDDDVRSVSDMSDRGSEAENSMADDSESRCSSSEHSSTSNDEGMSEVGVCNSSPARSASEDFVPGAPHDWSSNPFNLSPKKGRLLLDASSPSRGAKYGGVPARQLAPGAPLPVQRKARVGPPTVKLRWSGQSFSLNLNDFASISELRAHIHRVTGVPAIRQTLILGGKRLPINEDSSPTMNEPNWQEIKDLVRPGQCLMMVGSVPDPHAVQVQAASAPTPAQATPEVAEAAEVAVLPASPTAAEPAV